MSWPFYSVASHCPCNQMLQLSHWLHCPSQCPCSEALLLPFLLSNNIRCSQALSGSDRWSWCIPWTSSLSAFPWTRSSHLLCPAKGICRSRWKGKTVSSSLLSEVNLLGHKPQSLEITEKMVSMKKKLLTVRLLQFPYKCSQSVLAALRSTKLAPSTDVCSGLIYLLLNWRKCCILGGLKWPSECWCDSMIENTGS